MFLIVNLCHGCFTKVSPVLGFFNLKFSWAVAVEPWLCLFHCTPGGLFQATAGGPSHGASAPATLGDILHAGGGPARRSKGWCFSVRKSGKHLATRRNSLTRYDHPKITSWVVYNEFFEDVTIYNPEVVESVAEIKLLKLLRRPLSF